MSGQSTVLSFVESQKARRAGRARRAVAALMAGLGVCAIASLLARPLGAWDGKGHMMVAYVAYQQLTQATKDRVDKLLRKNPYYKTKWKGLLPDGVNDADKKMYVFMLAATWPDEIKGGDDNYKDDALEAGTADEDGNYNDKKQHRYWHFVDLAFSTDSTAVPGTPAPNAETQIERFRDALKSNKSDKQKSYDLVWLLHLVGDVHQPLHCTTRVDAAHQAGDRGGNAVTICLETCGSDLHTYWDHVLGDASKPDEAVPTAQALPAADAGKAGNVTTHDWVTESFGLAKTTVYVDPVLAGVGPFTLTQPYKDAAKALARQQIALAGARLARILNNELK